MRAEPVLPLLWQQGVVFASGCAGSCAHSVPSWDSPSNRDYVITPEPAAFEPGTIGQIQKKQMVFIPILFKPSPQSVPANCCLLKEADNAVSFTDKIGAICC